MAECSNGVANIYCLPPEIIRKIFCYLPVGPLTRCRQVNKTWRDISDSLSKNDKIWRRHCQTRFPDVYEEARIKAKPGLYWFHLYRSLSVWRMLHEATEERTEFARASRVCQSILSCRILNDGTLGVLKKGALVYYDIDTLSPSNRQPIVGEFVKYAETNHWIGLLSYFLQLFLIRKISPDKREHIATFDDIKMFTLTDDAVYFVENHKYVHAISLRRSKLYPIFMIKFPAPVVALSQDETRVNMLAKDRHILSVTKNSAIQNYLTTGIKVFEQAHNYKFFDGLSYRFGLDWMFKCNIMVGPLQDTVLLKRYGDFFFVGTHWGVLSIFYAPLADGEFNIFNSYPYREFDLLDSEDAAIHGTCRILNVEVREMFDGHAVFVAMPKKIIALNFSHDFGIREESIREPMIEEVVDEDMPMANLAVAGPSGQ